MAEAPAVDETLTPDDAVDVLEEILPAQNKSYELGLKLKLPQHVVEAIHSKNLPPERCLLEVLIKFSQQTEPRSTWRVIIEALKSPAVNLPAVNLPALAERVQAARFPDPTATRDVVPETTGATSTTSADEEVKPKPSRPVTENDVRDKVTQLHNRFLDLKRATREHLENQEVPVKDVTDDLTSLAPYEGEVHHKLFLRDNLKDLLGATDHHQVFVFMNFHWDYLNYHLLEVVIKRFDMPKIKDEMRSYKLDLKVFMKNTPLTLFCNVHQRRPDKPQGFCELVAEFNWPKDEDVTLEVVEDFRKKYADEYNLKDFAMMLEDVRPGSFVVTWLVPESLIGMLQLHQKLPIALLRKCFVTELKVAGVSVYPFQESSSGYSSYNYLGHASSVAASERSWQNTEYCIDFKFLGKCENSQCNLVHGFRERTSHESLEIPDKILLATAIKGTFLRLLRQIAECSLREAGINQVAVVVSRQNRHLLPEIVEEYKVLLSQLYPRGPRWCYIHRDGIAQCPSLEFKQYEGNIPVGPGEARELQDGYFELCISKKDGSELKYLSVKDPPQELEGDSDTKEGLHKTLSRVHGVEQFDPQGNQKDYVKVIEDHKDHIKQRLAEGLEWFYKEKRKLCILKLEGRFGKILWKHLPCDGSFGVKDFEEFCNDSKVYSRTFRPNVKQGSADTVRGNFQEAESCVLETFDIKFTKPRERERNAIDVRVKFEQGKPILILAKKNEKKIVVFDVLYLHRNHDVRMSLSYYEVVQPGSAEHAVVEQLLKTMSLAPVDNETIALVTKTDDWCVNFIRHKKKKTYYHKNKYLVTVTEVSEFQLERESQKSSQVHIYPDKYRKSHTECELHNCSWDCAFGRDVGFLPKQSLILHTETPTVAPEVERAIQHPWQPEHIMEDFEDFWKTLDSINGMIGPSP